MVDEEIPKVPDTPQTGSMYPARIGVCLGGLVVLTLINVAIFLNDFNKKKKDKKEDEED